MSVEANATTAKLVTNSVEAEAPQNKEAGKDGEPQGFEVQLVQADLKSRMHSHVVKLIRDPHFQTVTVCTAGGAITFSTVGGAFGCATGVAIGSLVGLLPAPLTFGLSIPAGAAVGGGIGLSSGALACGAAGALGGGAVGHHGHKNREQITAFVFSVKASANGRIEGLRFQAVAAHGAMKAKAADLTLVAKRTAAELAQLPKHQRFQATAAGATAGGLAGVAAGGVGGVVAGGVGGAAIGLPFALFTFGLSIPACAVVGGGVGGATGATAGGNAGAVVGGTAAYHGHKYRKEIRSGAARAWLRASDSAGKLRAQANKKVVDVGSRVSALIGGGTGGTE